MDIDLLPTVPDFDRIDALPAFPAGQGRLVVGAQSGANGPALLFVHGAYHGAWCYAGYLDYFPAHGIACAALDLPGHGWLPPPRDFARHGVRDFGRCVVDAIDLMANAVVLVGHSLGALPALWAATQRDVAGVVLIAPSPPSNVPGAQPLPPVPPGASRAPPGPDEIRRRFASGLACHDIAAIAARLCPESAEALNDRYLLRMEIPPCAISVPGLCLEAGVEDHDRHPPGQDKAIADLYDFEYRRLADLPHCMMYAQGWQDSAEVIREWHARTFGR
jgi:pimeloyl-ACP methyl ester carboxylesterase